MKINFPEVKAGQALICGIAIACKGDLDSVRSFSAHSFSWAAQDKEVMEKTPKELLPEDKNARANVTYQAEDAVLKGKFIRKRLRNKPGFSLVKVHKAVLLGTFLPVWHKSMLFVLNYMNVTGKPMKVRMQFIDSKGGGTEGR